MKRTAGDWLIHISGRRSSENRRQFILLIILLAVIGGGAAGLGMLVYHSLSRSDFFQITEIRINGIHRLGRDRVLTLGRVRVGDNLLSLNPDKIKTRLAAEPWIAGVEVDRQWPNRLIINIKERKPLCLLNQGGKLSYVDGHGRVFAAVEAGEELDYPVISGLPAAAKAGPPGSSLTPALKFIHYAAEPGSDFLPRQNISELHFSRGGIILFMADRPFPIYLGTVIDKKLYSRLARVLAWLYKHRKFKEVSYIKMGYGNEKILVVKNR
ncbi:cell division protein FtsQ/DivIB [Desulfobacterota bacterium M19]